MIYDDNNGIIFRPLDPLMISYELLSSAAPCRDEKQTGAHLIVSNELSSIRYGMQTYSTIQCRLRHTHCPPHHYDTTLPPCYAAYPKRRAPAPSGRAAPGGRARTSVGGGPPRLEASQRSGPQTQCPSHPTEAFLPSYPSRRVAAVRNLRRPACWSKEAACRCKGDLSSGRLKHHNRHQV
eukprot:3607597-Pleurochrysis_carterae.AAC.2